MYPQLGNPNGDGCACKANREEPQEHRRRSELLHPRSYSPYKNSPKRTRGVVRGVHMRKAVFFCHLFCHVGGDCLRAEFVNHGGRTVGGVGKALIGSGVGNRFGNQLEQPFTSRASIRLAMRSLRGDTRWWATHHLGRDRIRIGSEGRRELERRSCQLTWT
jgi:hypothetical protein